MTISEQGLDLVGLIEKFSSYEAYKAGLRAQVDELYGKMRSCVDLQQDLAKQIYETLQANGIVETPVRISDDTVVTLTKCPFDDSVDISIQPLVDLRQLEVAA